MSRFVRCPGCFAARAAITRAASAAVCVSESLRIAGMPVAPLRATGEAPGGGCLRRPRGASPPGCPPKVPLARAGPRGPRTGIFSLSPPPPSRWEGGAPGASAQDQTQQRFRRNWQQAGRIGSAAASLAGDRLAPTPPHPASAKGSYWGSLHQPTSRNPHRNAAHERRGPPPHSRKRSGGYPGAAPCSAQFAPALRGFQAVCARAPAGLRPSARPSSALAGDGPPLVAAWSLFRHGARRGRAWAGARPSALRRPAAARASPGASPRRAVSPWPRALKLNCRASPPVPLRCGAGRGALVSRADETALFSSVCPVPVPFLVSTVILARSPVPAAGPLAPRLVPVPVGGCPSAAALILAGFSPAAGPPGRSLGPPGAILWRGAASSAAGQRRRAAVANLNCARRRLFVRASPRGSGPSGAGGGLVRPLRRAAKVLIDFSGILWYNIICQAREIARGPFGGPFLFAFARQCCFAALRAPGGGFAPPPALPSGEGAPGVRGAAPLIVAADKIPLSDLCNFFVTVPGAWQTPGAGAAPISGAALRASPPLR